MDGKKKRRTFLCAIIDDHSRVIVGSKWSFEENLLTLESAFKEAIFAFGIPERFYCDNGKVFNCAHLQMVGAKLNIALLHSKPYDSPSRGKIERFFYTVGLCFYLH